MSFIEPIGGFVKEMAAVVVAGIILVGLFFAALTLLAMAVGQANPWIAGLLAIVGFGILLGLYLKFK